MGNGVLIGKSALLLILLSTLTQDLPAQDEDLPVVWQYDTNSPSYGSGAAADIDGDGKLEIVFGTYFNDGHLYAINAEDGSLLWKHESNGGPMDASVAIADVDDDGQLEVLSADSADGTLFCLNGAGELEWEFALPSGTDSPPAIADLDSDGTLEIVVGTMIAYREADSENGRVVVLNGKTQEIVWTAKVPGHVQSEPALVDLNGDEVLDVIVTNWLGDNNVRALDGTSGDLLWQYEMPDKMYHGISIVDLGEAIGVVATCMSGDVHLLDAKGNRRWARKVNGSCFAPATIADIDNDQKVEIITCTTRVVAFDLAGQVKWESPPLGSIARGVTIGNVNGDDDLELFCGAGRSLCMLDGGSGELIHRWDLTVKGHIYEGVDHAPLIGDFDGDGQLDVFAVTGKGTSDDSREDNYGRAYLLRVGKGTGSWLTFRGSLRRTGGTSQSQ